MNNKIKFSAFIGALLIGQVAWSVPVTYKIDLGALPGNSANWLYRVNNECNSDSHLDLNDKHRGDTLHFCGSQYDVVNGNITGDRESQKQKLAALAGMLPDLKIVGGSLGRGREDIERLAFAGRVAGARGPASRLTQTGGHQVLTGKRQDTRTSHVDRRVEIREEKRAKKIRNHGRKGLHGHGVRHTTVPEPTAIALLALGMGAIAWTLRR